MRAVLRHIKWSMILAALAYVVLGAVLLAWPDATSVALCTLLGAVLVGYGVFQVVSFFWKGDGSWSWAVIDLLVGICALALGVFALMRPQAVLSVFPIALGAVVIVDSCVSLKRALQLRELGMTRWWVVCLLAVATALFGIVVVFRPFASLTVLVRIIGGVLVYEGLADLVTVIHVARYTKLALEAESAVPGEVIREEDRGA